MIKNKEDEGNAVDYMTGVMFSIAFLESITNFIFSKNRDDLTVGQFYDEFSRKVKYRRTRVPFSLGIILGELYVILLWGRENWKGNWNEIFPTDEIKEIGEQWGLSEKHISSSKGHSLSIEYVMRRIRNALAHAHVKIIVPKDIKKKDMFKMSKIEFRDVDLRDKSDTFIAILTFEQVFKLIKKTQSKIHKYVREK